MLEAIRNRDYSFRLPVYGFSGGERILLDTLNQFGTLMGEQKQLMEQRERFYEQILSSVTSGVVVLDEQMKVIQTNPAASRLLAGNAPAIGTIRKGAAGQTPQSGGRRALQSGVYHGEGRGISAGARFSHAGWWA